MNVKMTQELRTQISKNAKRASPINKELEKLLNDRYDICEKIRIESLGGIEEANKFENIRKELQKIRDTLPDNIITSDMGIQYRNYMYVVLHPSNNRILIYLKSPNVCPKDNYHLEKGSNLAILFSQSLELENKYKKQLDSVFTTVHSSISGITTVKKLLEMWPEAKELLPSKILQVKTNLPALKTDQLNKLIGLPTKGNSK